MAVGVPENVFVTKLDAAANWARTNSLWPMPFATACCGIELMATASSVIAGNTLFERGVLQGPAVAETLRLFNAECARYAAKGKGVFA